MRKCTLLISTQSSEKKGLCSIFETKDFSLMNALLTVYIYPRLLRASLQICRLPGKTGTVGSALRMQGENSKMFIHSWLTVTTSTTWALKLFEPVFK